MHVRFREYMDMRSATTSGLALVLAALLFLCPMGVCAPTESASVEPSHPCCPAKHTHARSDLPGCSLLFLDTGSVPAVTSGADLGVTVLGSFDSVVLWDRDTAATDSAATGRSAPHPALAVLRQFRI